jgi:hypothetical protein
MREAGKRAAGQGLDRLCRRAVQGWTDNEALATLDLLRNPNTAEALNYRGYAMRKLGRVDERILRG